MRRSIFVFFVLMFYLQHLSAQISPPFPDNVYDMECYITPEAFQWSIQVKDSSNYQPPLMAQLYTGDIDNDGQIEIIAVGESSTIIIYDHALNYKAQIPLPCMPYVEYGECPLAIADVDHDGIAEIFVVVRNSYSDSYYTIHCYNYTGITLITKWTAVTPQYGTTSLSFPVIADINADGIPDILILDRIYNAQTGELELILPTMVGTGISMYQRLNMPVLADMDNDGLLEVVGGNTIIKVNITNPHGTAGNNAFIWKNLTGANIGDGQTSVADIDLDGYLDVIVNVAYTLDHTGQNYLYVWKPYTGVSSSPSLLGTFSYNSINSISSRVLVADFNNDGYPEMAWSHPLNIQACKYNPVTQNLELLWQHSTSDGSGNTGMSAFDFNQDGFLEIVYRDETHLRIIDGVTGLNISAIPCRSITSIEYPIIVDIDNDGTAEILTSQDYYPRIIYAFKSGGDVGWAPARSVWNQYSYNVVHINEDLTVPQYQFNPATAFTNPTTGAIRRPFNHYLQQVGPINQYGDPFMPVSDATFIEDSTQIVNLCDSVVAVLYIHNQGNRMLASQYKVTTYKNTYQGDIIQTDNIPVSLPTDSTYKITLTFSPAEFNAFLPITNLVFAVNDAGTGIAQTGGQQTECDTLNNLLIIPFLYTSDTVLSVQLPSDTTICNGTSVTAISENIISWLWSDGSTNAEFFPEHEGNYSLTVFNNNCYTDTFSINIHFFEPAEVNLGNDTVFCHLRSLILDAQHSNAQSYLWQDYSTNSTYTVYFDGEYWVVVTDHCGHISDTINIGYLTDLQVNFGSDTTLCEGETLLLDATIPYSQYVWQDGSAESAYTVTDAGCYWVSISNICFSVSDTIYVEMENCDPDIKMPNVFTPNSDGVNDVLLPDCIHPENISDYQLFIYNRWGKEIFKTSSYATGWDGRVGGTECSNGTYFYILEYTNQKGKEFSLNGSVTLIR